MKLKLLILTLFISIQSFGQSPIKFKLRQSPIITNINGNTISRGDEFELWIDANGNGNTTTRQLLFDLQYDYINFDLISINHTGTGGNGGILPGGSNIQLSHTTYPGYNYITSQQNTTSNGTTNYQYANYQYSSSSQQSIIRATLTWATPNGMPYGSYDRLLVLKFRLKSTSTSTSFDPMKLNFIAGWDANGGSVATFQENPLSSTVLIDQNASKLVTAKVDINSNLLALSNIKVSFRDTVSNVGQLFNVLSDGTVDINQSLLSENKIYQVNVMHEMDKMYLTYNGAITISDFTTAQSEFTTMGLNGSNGQILKTGQSLYAADINRNKVIDGGDLPQLLAQVVGLDTLFTLPSGYSVGAGGWISLPTWRATNATSISGQVEWAYVTPNLYSQGVSRLMIDNREFSGTNINSNQIKSIQIFDIYSGPVEFIGSDGTWTEYKIPSSLIKATNGTSLYLPFIRNVNNSNVDYSLKSEWEFNASPSSSWGSISTSNWNTITYPKTYIKTGLIGSNTVLELKYLLWGDVNRSHSSQVVNIDNSGSSYVQTNAINSLNTNKAFKLMSLNSSSFINTPYDVSSINVNLSNLTVTSNAIEIPINVDTKGAELGGLQFEFIFDPNKIKFEELSSSVPNTWYVFANSKSGKVKFGALDQNKNPINGTNIPFKLKFSTIGNGVDILTSIKVSPTMDASDSKGKQLGINLNITQIKLTGYKNF
jgi:hypothetical protein